MAKSATTSKISYWHRKKLADYAKNTLKPLLACTVRVRGTWQEQTVSGTSFIKLGEVCQLDIFKVEPSRGGGVIDILKMENFLGGGPTNELFENCLGDSGGLFFRHFSIFSHVFVKKTTCFSKITERVYAWLILGEGWYKPTLTPLPPCGNVWYQCQQDQKDILRFTRSSSIDKI